MKYTLTAPVPGDIIRVSVGSIHHYGIYVSDNEVIQFGRRPDVVVCKKEDIQVLSTSVEEFYQSSFLETAVLSRKEKKDAFKNTEVIDRARKRIGETGYDILRNNCEHFVFECVFGIHYSTQTDSVRDRVKELIKSNSVNHLVYVYYSKLLPIKSVDDIYQTERINEINNVSSLRVKEEKYTAFILLDLALKEHYKQTLKSVKMSKHSTNKWFIDNLPIYFSISHSSGIVCVAISDIEIGIDIEEVLPLKNEKIIKKVFNKEELNSYLSLNEIDRLKYFYEIWTKKEASFKSQNKLVFSLQQDTSNTFTEEVQVDNRQFIMSIAPSNVKLMISKK